MAHEKLIQELIASAIKKVFKSLHTTIKLIVPNQPLIQLFWTPIPLPSPFGGSTVNCSLKFPFYPSCVWALLFNLPRHPSHPHFSAPQQPLLATAARARDQALRSTSAWAGPNRRCRRTGRRRPPKATKGGSILEADAEEDLAVAAQ